jgi:excisionase family DNA binding protein
MLHAAYLSGPETGSYLLEHPLRGRPVRASDALQPPLMAGNVDGMTTDMDHEHGLDRTQPDNSPEPWITETPAYRHLGISSRTLRRWVAEGLIPAHRAPSGRLRFRISELDKAMTPVQPVADDG